LTEVSVKELEPDPLELLLDIVTLVAAMVNPGVAASAGELETTKLNARRNPRTTIRRYPCMAETFLRVVCTLPVWLDEG
jgi:hypothetical protein